MSAGGFADDPAIDVLFDLPGPPPPPAHAEVTASRVVLIEALRESGVLAPGLTLEVVAAAADQILAALSPADAVSRVRLSALRAERGSPGSTGTPQDPEAAESLPAPRGEAGGA